MVEHSNHGRDIGARKSTLQLLDRLAVRLLARICPYSRAQRVIAHVQHREGELSALLGNLRADLHSAYSQLRLARDEPLIVARLNCVAVFGGAGLENRADRIVRGDFLEPNDRRLHAGAVDLCGALMLWYVAFRLF